MAAIALWEYSERCVSYIFGDKLGDTTADIILAELRSVFPDGLSRTEINVNLFGKHTERAEIDRALQLIKERKRA